MSAIRLISVILLVCLLIASVNAISIDEVSQQNALYYADTGDIAEGKTIENLCRWTADNIDYQFGTYPRGIEFTLSYLIGDCTDKSEVIFQAAKILGINLKKCHGYVDGEKHDWLMYQDKIVDSFKFPSYELTGAGYW